MALDIRRFSRCVLHNPLGKGLRCRDALREGALQDRTNRHVHFSIARGCAAQELDGLLVVGNLFEEPLDL